MNKYLLFGVDFFPIKNLYLGLEVGLGYELIKYKQIIVKNSSNDEATTYPSGAQEDFGFYYNNALRLGVRF